MHQCVTEETYSGYTLVSPRTISDICSSRCFSNFSRWSHTSLSSSRCRLSSSMLADNCISQYMLQWFTGCTEYLGNMITNLFQSLCFLVQQWLEFKVKVCHHFFHWIIVVIAKVLHVQKAITHQVIYRQPHTEYSYNINKKCGFILKYTTRID